MAVGNGSGGSEGSEKQLLPDPRRAAVMAGLEQYHAMAADRDELTNETGKLRVELAALRVMVDAHDSLQTQADSRVASAYAERDQAVRERARYEALHMAILAMCREFGVPEKAPTGPSPSDEVAP